MKYSFLKIGQDTYKFIYEDKNGIKKEKEFTRTNKHREMIESIAIKTSVKTAKYLADEGLSYEDIVIKKNDGKGHITYDEKEYLEIKNQVKNQVTYEIINKICEDCLGSDITNIFIDTGLDINSNKKEDINEVTKFMTEFLKIIQGIDIKEPFPSEEIKNKK